MPAIKVENLSKEYVIGGRRERHRTIREDLSGGFASPLRTLRRLVGGPSPGERFRALDGVSFEVAPGEAVGIIGRNGAGKSTLLKILSRITDPTSGRAELSGRVSSLLEVGTGFHPELTGRENVFLNGALLGMSKSEVRAKFDEIVAFSEVEKFIDTPVKRYSSGMYLRLAFAVAAHLDPEILIVDEVLAVGDAPFQRKCLGKMEEAGKQGRTILFVSHNMGAVRRFCGRAVWLDEGRVRRTGTAADVADEYIQKTVRAEGAEDIGKVLSALPPDPVFRLKGISVRQGGAPCASVVNGRPAEIAVRYAVRERTAGLRVFFDLCDDEGNILIRSFNDDDADVPSVVDPGEYVSSATVPADLLAPRTYELRVFGTIHNVRSIPPGGVGIPFPVEASNGLNRAYPNEPVRSRLQARIPWRTEEAPRGPAG
jgi:lipopolysaccharide transport system ATP-binding protein